MRVHTEINVTWVTQMEWKLDFALLFNSLVRSVHLCICHILYWTFRDRYMYLHSPNIYIKHRKIPDLPSVGAYSHCKCMLTNLFLRYVLDFPFY